MEMTEDKGGHTEPGDRWEKMVVSSLLFSSGKPGNVTHWRVFLL